MNTGLVIVTKDRPEYLRRCLDSLSKADLEGVCICIIDDASQDEQTLSILYESHVENCQQKNNRSEGINSCLLKGFEYLISEGCDFLINLDSDAIVTPDFVRRLEAEHHMCGGIFSGFNKGGGVEVLSGILSVPHLNGINLAFDLQDYENRVKPALKSAGNWDYNVGAGYVLSPSCVQHIGYKSSMGHDGDVDLAVDFPPTLHLPDVTLFGIDSSDPEGLKNAAMESQRDIAFGSYRIITDDLFTKGGTREQRREDYSRFCIEELHKHFHTSHLLIIHADGWVVNPLAWRDEWLQYDYLGAPWWFHTDGYSVGNGGFSLRSHKLCKFLAEANLEHVHPEDHHICRTYRASLEAAGFKFAPEEVAAQFSVEGQPYQQQFGFHGKQVDFTGADIARVAFRNIQVLDPVKAAEDARRKRSDRWRK